MENIIRILKKLSRTDYIYKGEFLAVLITVLSVEMIDRLPNSHSTSP